MQLNLTEQQADHIRLCVRDLPPGCAEQVFEEINQAVNRALARYWQQDDDQCTVDCYIMSADGRAIY
jgi:hypothetical protein